MHERAAGSSASSNAADGGSLVHFRALIAGVLRELPDVGLDAKLKHWLNTRYGPSTQTFERIREACLRGIHEGWACARERGGIRYGRVLRPADDLRQFSVDVVDMHDVVGPRHLHPEGEIDLILPLHGDARFDGHPAGWLVYPPGSSHAPTVSGGRALILYLLPQGRIEFSAV